MDVYPLRGHTSSLQGRCLFDHTPLGAAKKKADRMTKDVQFKIRMTTAERNQLKATADRHGISAADLVRLVCLGDRVATRLPDRDLLTKILRQVVSIARNVNQATEALNKARLAESAGALMQQLDQARIAIDTAADRFRDELRRVAGAGGVL